MAKPKSAAKPKKKRATAQPETKRTKAAARISVEALEDFARSKARTSSTSPNITSLGVGPDKDGISQKSFVDASFSRKTTSSTTFDLDPFRMYQVSLADLEGRTNLNFGTLKKADTFKKGVI